MATSGRRRGSGSVPAAAANKTVNTMSGSNALSAAARTGLAGISPTRKSAAPGSSAGARCAAPLTPRAAAWSANGSDNCITPMPSSTPIRVVAAKNASASVPT